MSNQGRSANGLLPVTQALTRAGSFQACSTSGLFSLYLTGLVDHVKVPLLQVPTFLFFRDGKNVGRHVGSSRADLIGHILQQQKNAGVDPPTTGQGPSQSRREKIVRRV